MIDRNARQKTGQLLSGLTEGSITLDEVEAQYVGQPFPDDPAVLAVLGGVWPIAPWLDKDDCGDWQACGMACGSCTRFARKSDQRKSADAKRTVARAIRFLNTDQEYRWNEGVRLTWWMVPLVLVVLVVGVMLCCAVAFAVAEGLAKLGVRVEAGSVLFVPALLLGVLVCAVFGRLSAKISGKDRRYWPFHGRREYEASGS